NLSSLVTAETQREAVSLCVSAVNKRLSGEGIMRLARWIAGSCLVILAAALYTAAASSDVADAAMKRDASAVRGLLQQKADVNAAQSDGSTALHWAVHFDDVNMVQMLISAGANVKAANRFRVTPLSLACENGN